MKIIEDVHLAVFCLAIFLGIGRLFRSITKKYPSWKDKDEMKSTAFVKRYKDIHLRGESQW